MMGDNERIKVAMDLYGAASGKLRCDLIVPRGLSDEEVRDLVFENENTIYAPSNLLSFEFEDDECHDINIYREDGRPLFCDEGGA
jgi:hypothetical protein